MSDSAWPLPEAVASWRPDSYQLDTEVPATSLTGEDGTLPAWLAVESGADLEDTVVPACCLATSVLETRVGNTDGIDVLAIPDRDGGYRIVVLDDYDMTYSVPIAHTAQPLTTAELQRVIDESGPVGEPDYVGIGQAWRERNVFDPQDVADVAAASRVVSDVYPGIEPADLERKAAWVREQGPS